MTLNEILEQLQARIDFMAKMDDAEWSEWISTYQAIAQVKQAIAMERQNTLLNRLIDELVIQDR